jgi:hypothetical protein
MIPCKETTLVVGMSGGIGYLIPKPVTYAINFVLGTLHINYQIDSAGGVSSDRICSSSAHRDGPPRSQNWDPAGRIMFTSRPRLREQAQFVQCGH